MQSIRGVQLAHANGRHRINTPDAMPLVVRAASEIHATTKKMCKELKCVTNYVSRWAHITLIGRISFGHDRHAELYSVDRASYN